MRRSSLLVILGLLGLVLSSCGAPLPVFNPAQQELGRKHCNANADCASGLCRDGVCG